MKSVDATVALRHIDTNSVDYMAGYVDGVRAATEGRATLNPDAESVTITEEVGDALIQPETPSTTALHEDESHDTYIAEPIPKVRTSNQAAHSQPAHVPSQRFTTINSTLYVASLLLVSGILLLAQTSTLFYGTVLVVAVMVMADSDWVRFAVGLHLSHDDRYRSLADCRRHLCHSTHYTYIKIDVYNRARRMMLMGKTNVANPAHQRTLLESKSV